MSSQTVINQTSHTGDAGLWRSLALDLGFWTMAGAGVALAAAPLGRWLGLSTGLLLGLGLVFCMGAAGFWALLRSRRPLGPGLVWAFVLFNGICALACWAAALFGWFSLTTAATWALVTVGDVCLVLGIVQFYALRKFAVANR